MLRSVTTPLAIALVLSIAQLAIAQVDNTGSTATSAFGTGTRTLGQGISSPLPTGTTGAPGSLVESLNTAAGEVTGSERFIQDNRQPGTFVGADTAEAGANVFSQQGAGGQGGRGGGGLGGQFGNQFSQFNFNQPGQGQRGGAQQTQRRTLRAPVRIAFEVPARSSSDVLSRFRSSIARTPLVRLAGTVSVTVEGRTAVIRGVIESEQKRDMLTRIAKMEPGISSVRNEVVVQPPSSSGSVQPTLSLPQAR